MKRFGVIGHPIAHSLSPLMHTTAYSLLGMDCLYEAFDVSPDSLAATLQDFKARGFSGLNVTIPHKERVAALMDELSDEAKAVGAVNTISFENDWLKGENSDVYGVAASLEPHRELFEDQPVLVIGAGGSARAIVYALITRFRPAEIVVANRDPLRARTMVGHFLPLTHGITLRASSADEVPLRQLAENSRLVINATPLGMFPANDDSPITEQTRFHSKQVVLDSVYVPLETKILTLARRCGARTIGGLEMFLHQGARSFELWFGYKMPLEHIRKVIAEELNNRQRTHNS